MTKANLHCYSHNGLHNVQLLSGNSTMLARTWVCNNSGWVAMDSSSVNTLFTSLGSPGEHLTATSGRFLPHHLASSSSVITAYTLSHTCTVYDPSYQHCTAFTLPHTTWPPSTKSVVAYFKHIIGICSLAYMQLQLTVQIAPTHHTSKHIYYTCTSEGLNN